MKEDGNQGINLKARPLYIWAFPLHSFIATWFVFHIILAHINFLLLLFCQTFAEMAPKIPKGFGSVKSAAKEKGGK